MTYEDNINEINRINIEIKQLEDQKQRLQVLLNIKEQDDNVINGLRNLPKNTFLIDDLMILIKHFKINSFSALSIRYDIDNSIKLRITDLSTDNWHETTLFRQDVNN